LKNARLTLTALAIAASFSLTACGGANGSAPQEAPKVNAAESAAPSASPSPSPSTKKAVVPPAIKGVVTDGTSSFLQTTVDETNAGWEIDLSVTTDATKAKLDKADVQDAWEVAAKFLAEEGIDSPLRAGGAADNPEVFNKWVEENRSRFVTGAKFVPGEADKGNTLDSTWGIQQDDADFGLTYDNGGTKPRVTERTITQGQVEFNEDGSFAFSPSIEYKMAVKDATGKDKTVQGTARFVTTVVQEDGTWKIRKNSATFYPIKFMNSDGTTTQVR
jgi:hypothetical protein